MSDSHDEGVAMLNAAVEKRRKAWEMEKEAGELKREASEEMEIAMAVLGIKSAYSPIFGSVVQIDQGTTSRLDKDALKNELLKRGVPAQVIADSVAAATKEGKKAGYVKYQPPESLKTEPEAELRF